MADLAYYVEQAAEEFVKEDNPIVDDYFDKFLGDLKLSEKHAYALIGLCEICFAKGMIKAMDMFAINKYKRKPVTDVSIKVYLNGRFFTEAAGHSAEAMGDKKIVQKVLSLALDSFFPDSSDMKKKYDFALEYFSRLRDNEEKGVKK